MICRIVSLTAVCFLLSACAVVNVPVDAAVGAVTTGVGLACDAA